MAFKKEEAAEVLRRIPTEGDKTDPLSYLSRDAPKGMAEGTGRG